MALISRMSRTLLPVLAVNVTLDTMWDTGAMSATLEAPTIHRWVDRLNAAERAELGRIVQNSSIPPISDANLPVDQAYESWLRTTVAETYDRVADGVEPLFTPEEADAWLAATRVAA
ncbi:MAG: hypothetical protein LBH13_03605 [Cellulomonadaceae bacterium]|jgi:hypothetical protein|nr:hypothetical protein [Cellulomonadaceae bacterium]